MIQEDYVSFEVAKLLKEKGFEYNSNESYWLIDANNKIYWISCIGAYDYVDVPTESFQRPKNGYRLVTQAVAMKWLSEVHGLHCNSDYDFVLGWYCQITSLTETVEDHYTEMKHYHPEKVNGFSSPEEACEEAIRYCLQNLI